MTVTKWLKEGDVEISFHGRQLSFFFIRQKKKRFFRLVLEGQFPISPWPFGGPSHINILFLNLGKSNEISSHSTIVLIPISYHISNGGCDGYNK